MRLLLRSCQKIDGKFGHLMKTYGRVLFTVGEIAPVGSATSHDRVQDETMTQQATAILPSCIEQGSGMNPETARLKMQSMCDGWDGLRR